ncbi:hypothetical protein MIND_00035600 [Mycena indigotica]|uniref:TPR-like protein n=1 Tax=Mycena indigotica TaxID=2126181 RepID=A0A8H6WEV7_9AGAR|nr:uncharacterized protein MIND_00035600 [Mycena indigotica]KAF7315212.1 hypothetical protein MIND_00035600 [Mycena indigotica]
MQDLPVLEKSLLLGSWDPSISTESSTLALLAKAVVDADFREALVTSQYAVNALTASFLEGSGLRAPTSAEDSASLLFLGIASLHAFVQINWTGPELDFGVRDVLRITSEADSEDALNQKAVSQLSMGGEPAYHLSKCAMLLVLAQNLFEIAASEHCPSVLWWRLRAATVHQHLLDEPVPVPAPLLLALEPLKSLYNGDAELAGRLELEEGLLQHTLSQDKLAGEYFVRSARATGMEYELTGALGKRTKFQQTELSQLVLLAESQLKLDDKAATASSTPSHANIPETLPLNDDTLLEQTVFTSSSPSAYNRLAHLDPSSQPALHPLDQCILLSMCLNVKNTSPVHGLTAEQMSPYVARVISHPLNWSVHTMALLLRARLEANRTRTVERATLQLQALVEQMPTTDSTVAPAAVRLKFVHALPLPSKWEMEKELASRFLSLGVVRSALEIFERLEMWEEVVKCWQALDRRDQGERIVRDLLEGRKAEADVVLARGKQATTNAHRLRMDTAREAKLWCLLGDLEPDHAIDHYQKAWALSGETAGRAMRSLGGYYFARGQYQEAIECLKKAVVINPLLSRSWFVLGCACMRVENWEEARAAFTRCVTIDEEDGESWSNLASMYMRIGTTEGESTVPFENKLLAFRALKQGLRSAYENWRMWYNFMIVAIDHLDIDVLERLVNAVTRADASSSIEDAANQPNSGRALFRPVMHLMEDIVLPKISSSSRVFLAYARLLRWAERWGDALKASMDAYRCGAASELDNTSDVTKWREAVTEVRDVVDALRNFGPRAEDVGGKWRGQARSVVRSFMGKTKEAFGNEPEWAELEELLEELKKKDE